MKILPIDKYDVAALSNLQPEGWISITPFFEFYVNSSFCFPVKAVIDNKIVGVGSTVFHGDVAWLGHIIVDSDYRRRGIGMQITQSLVGIAKKNHCTTIYLIATEQGEPVYRKVGFETEVEYMIYTDIVSNNWIAPDRIYPYESKFRDQIAILDMATSCEDRLVSIEEHFRNSVVHCSGNLVDGYYMPTLGEGLIIANSETAGIELLKQHLRQRDRVVIPNKNHIAQDFLQKTGFGNLKAVKRMRLGEKREVRFSDIYNRIGGNIG